MRRRQRGDVIPADLLEEILHRLPSNDLLKFQIVCRDWLRLISKPEFIQKHLERSKADSREPRIVSSQDSPDISRDSPPDIEILRYCANNLTKKIRVMGHVSLLGTCDGLVLYYEPSSDKIGALNPSTGKTDARLRGKIGALNPYTLKNEMLPPYLITTSFGRHPATGEYVLALAFWKFGGKNASIVFRIYSLSRNSLLSSLTEELDEYSYCQCRDIGLFLHGRLHVPVEFIRCSREAEILAYDLQTNRMLIMWAPLQHCNALGVVDGCLCALGSSEVWMMKEYGVKKSWTKYANIDDNIWIRLEIYPNDDDVILKAFRDGATELLECFMRNRRVVVCRDSLVSPAVVWEKRE